MGFGISLNVTLKKSDVKCVSCEADASDGSKVQPERISVWGSSKYRFAVVAEFVFDMLPSESMNRPEPSIICKLRLDMSSSGGKTNFTKHPAVLSIGIGDVKLIV